VIEAPAARQALLRQDADLVELQLIEFSWGEMHESAFPG
jgi:hypothetical protein